MDSKRRCPNCDTINSAEKCVAYGKRKKNIQSASIKKSKKQNCLKNGAAPIKTNLESVNGQSVQIKQNSASLSAKNKNTIDLAFV